MEQLARTNTQKQYFLSDDVIAASYDGTPPSSFAEITSMDHVTISYENGNSGFSAKKSDLETVWDGLIKDSYDVPAVAASVEGIWVGRILPHYLSQQITGRIMTLMAWKPTVMRINVLSTAQKAFGLSPRADSGMVVMTVEVVQYLT